MSGVVLWALLGCGNPDDDDGDDDDAKQGACGEQHEEAFTVLAKVVDAEGPLAGIEVTLRDESVNKEFGLATSDADGFVTIDAPEVLVIDDCWGTAVDYHLVAEDPDGVYSTVKDDLNAELHVAYDDGSMLVDVRDFPLSME